MTKLLLTLLHLAVVTATLCGPRDARAVMHVVTSSPTGGARIRVVATFLESGDEIRCCIARGWHPVHLQATSSETPDSARMLVRTCREQQY